MHSTDRVSFRIAAALTLLAVASLLSVSFLSSAGAGDEKAAAPAGPMKYATAKEAAVALVEAASKNDSAALRKIFGPGSAAYVQDGKDPVVSKERAMFAEAAKKQARLEKNKDGSQTLVIGDNDWPLPFPLRSKDGKFWWDGPAGVEEMQMRRIGRNELRVIDVMKIYIEAQVEYAGTDHDGDEVREYAQRVRSSEGKRDGLYWPTEEDEPESPLGPQVAAWRQHLGGVAKGGRVPFGGYYYRVLTSQGREAPGGAHNYIINGNMIAGFALIAHPADYGKSGIMSFMVSHHGKVYERDFGRCTEQCICKINSFNPTKGWTVVKGE